MEKGKLIIIEAIDGSGKATQSKMLCSRLENEKYNVKRIEFPDYQSDSSALIKMYLKGEFGKKPDDVEPKIASTFYTIDRYASFKKKWESFYSEGGIIIADRYTTSNFIHQGVKIDNHEEKEDYFKWLEELEYGIFKLPYPDCVIFLDMPPEYSKKLLKERTTQKKEESIDIHEEDLKYLEKCYYNALNLKNKYNWAQVSCVENNKIKSKADINDEIYYKVKRIIDF